MSMVLPMSSERRKRFVFFRSALSVFKRGTEKEAALKPMEEAAEIYAAWHRYNHLGTVAKLNERAQILEKIADCIQACANFAYRIGCDDLTMDQLDVEDKNLRRGYYDEEKL